MAGPILNFGSFLYLVLSMLGVSYCAWRWPEPYHLTAFWPVPVAMVGVILWFLGACLAHSFFESKQGGGK